MKKKTNEESPKTVERVKQETIEILNYKDAVDKRNAAIKEGIDLFIKEALGGAEITPPPPILPQLPPDPLPDLEKSALSFSDYLQKLNGMKTEVNFIHINNWGTFTDGQFKIKNVKNKRQII